MINQREVLEIIDNIDINEEEFNKIDVELNDIEKKRIKKSYKDKIKYKKFSYKNAIVAVGLTITICTGMVLCSPVMASNIPVLSRIYENLGIYDEYEDYTTYVGQSEKIGKYTYTVEEIMVTPYKSLLGIKIKSDDIIPENHQGFMTSLEIGGVSWSSAESKNYRIDDNTIVTTIEHNYDRKVPKKSSIKLSIHSIDVNDDYNDTMGSFEFKANFDSSYSKFTTIPVKNIEFDKYGVKLNEINSGIMGTNIVSKIKSNEDDEGVYLSKNDKLEYILNVDGKFYSGYKYSNLRSTLFGIKGLAITEIDNLTFNDIDESKNIELMVYEAQYTNDEIIEMSSGEYREAEKTFDQGITYEEEYKFEDGTFGNLYGLERLDETVKVHYRGKESDIVPLTQNLRLYSNKNPNKYYVPNIYKNLNIDGEFIIEFRNIPKSDYSLEMTFWNNSYNSYSLLEEYKIK